MSMNKILRCIVYFVGSSVLFSTSILNAEEIPVFDINEGATSVNKGTASIGTASIGTASIGTASIGTASIGTASIGTANVSTGVTGNSSASINIEPIDSNIAPSVPDVIGINSLDTTKVISPKVPMRGRYRIEKDESQLEFGARGYIGRLHLKGEIKPDMSSFIAKVKKGSEKIAEAFIQQESDLFGLSDISELRLQDMKSSIWDETSTLTYKKYIGDAVLEGMVVKLRVKKNEYIDLVEGNLVDSPAEEIPINMLNLNNKAVEAITFKDLSSHFSSKGKEIDFGNWKVLSIDKIVRQSVPKFVYKIFVKQKSVTEGKPLKQCALYILIDRVAGKVVSREKERLPAGIEPSRLCNEI